MGTVCKRLRSARTEGLSGRSPLFAKKRRYHDGRLAVLQMGFDAEGEILTQTAPGRSLDELSKGDSAFAARIMTAWPDVTATTSLGPWVNGCTLFARYLRYGDEGDEGDPEERTWLRDETIGPVFLRQTANPL